MILKFAKNQGFTTSLEKIVLEKLLGGVKLTPSLFRVKSFFSFFVLQRFNPSMFDENIYHT